MSDDRRATPDDRRATPDDRRVTPDDRHAPNPEPAGPVGDAPPAPRTSPDRRPLNMKALYVRVIVVQALTLLALWLLQAAFA